ncbi:MAG: hypothetical protein SFW35_12800 [Chitinophagales bacterium]|nr:hypothetical protein [Chitinophagales bacterium]
MAIAINKLTTLQGHTGAVYSLAYDADRQLLYSAGGDGTVACWPLNKTGAPGKAIAKVADHIFSLCLQYPLLWLGTMQGKVSAIQIEDNQEKLHTAFSAKGVFDIQSVNGNIWLAGSNGMLGIGNAAQGLTTLWLGDDNLRCIAFQAMQGHLAIGSSNHHIYVLRQDGELVKRIEGHKGSVFTLCYSREGKYLLSGSRDAQIIVWDVAKNYELYRHIPAHLFTVNSIAYQPSGRLFASASRDKTIKIWDADSFDLLKVIDHQKWGGHVNSVNKLLWLGDDLLASCSDDRSIMIWQITIV